MNTIKTIGLSILVGASTIACNRTDDNTAGKGGAAILQCIPKHHDAFKNIVNGKVYIAYNTQDVPSKYDDSAFCTLIDGAPTAIFNGLKPGKYYLFATGNDTSINQAVKGGVGYTINSETTLNITVPVTEGD